MCRGPDEERNAWPSTAVRDIAARRLGVYGRR
jgi:hypothetical protein